MYRNNGANFNDHSEAISYITTNYSAIAAQFNIFVLKPTLNEIIQYISKHQNIQDIRV